MNKAWLKRVFLIITLTLILNKLAQAQYDEFDPIVLMQSSQDAPAAHDLADIDNDGIVDIVCASNNTGEIGWFKNNGDGTFEEFYVIISLGEGGFVDMECEDVDGDGDKDIVYADNLFLAKRIAFLENLGGGELATEETLLTTFGGTAQDIDFGDIDEDGNIDCILLTTSRLNYFRNNGDGVFTYEETIAVIEGVGNFARTCHVFDTDLDGDLDAVVGMQQDILDRVKYYENTGGTFIEGGTVAYVDNPRSAKAGDIDGDGDEDLITLSKGDDEIILTTNESGVLTTETIISSLIENPSDLNIIDYDQDGDLDLLVANDHELFLLYNGGLGVFEDPIMISNYFKELVGAKVALMNEDDFPDIVTISFNDDKVAYIENLDGIDYTNPTSLSSSSALVSRMIYQDIDADGSEDLLVLSEMDGKIASFRHLEDLTFGEQELVSDQIYYMNDFVSGDIDGDTDPDIVALEKDSSNITLFRNNGDGTFTDRSIISTELSFPETLTLSDLDNDGDQDLIVASTPEDLLVWFENADDGTFSAMIEISSSGNGPKSVISCDVDNDLDNDLIMVSAVGDQLEYYENDGTGSFSDAVEIESDLNYPTEVIAVDINEDDLKDIVVNSPIYGQIFWFENLGEGVFASQQIVGSEMENINEIMSADFDADGDQDILAVSHDLASDFRITACLNDGTGIFDEKRDLITTIEGAWSITKGDVDEDGDIEFFLGSGLENFKNLVLLFDNNTFDPYQIRGEIYVDENENGMRDPVESGAPFLSVTSAPDYSFALTHEDGTYYMNFDIDETGSFEISSVHPEYWSITSDSALYHVLLDGEVTYIDSIDFGLYPNELIDSLQVQLVGALARCNDEVNYWVNYQNIGSTKPSGILVVELDEQVEFLSSSIPPDSIIDQTIYWHYDSLYYFEYGEPINLTVEMPDFESLGDTLTSTVQLRTIDEGEILFETIDTLDQILVCAYDPNDKVVSPIGEGEEGIISIDQTTFEYTIRFQNTGTDTAFNVVIEDMIEEELDVSSLMLLGTSDPVSIDITPEGLVSFRFDDIMLPDSNTNELESHGYVRFRINLLGDPVDGTEINNTATIYFDDNPGIITNTTKNTYFGETGGEDDLKKTLKIKVYPNPFSDFTTIYFEEPLNEAHTIIIYDMMGKVVLRSEEVTREYFRIEKNSFLPGVYLLSISNGNDVITSFETIVKL